MALSRTAVQGASKRLCTAFSSWFVIPEQGMKDLEVLNRGSAFIIPARSKSFPHKYHVLTASHIVAPWRWPGLYGDDFLKYITEKNTHYTVELRHDDGSVMTQLDCIPRSYHHPKRDLAIMHLDDETEAIEFIEKIGVHVLNLCPRPGRGQSLRFIGHEVTNPNPFDVDPSGKDNRLPYPKTVEGRLEGWTKHQTFCVTDKVLHDGMCGGPVLVGPSTEACGMIEGIVPPDHDVEQLRGMAVFVEGDIISDFIDQVEADLVDEADVLVGGEAAEVVGADQDPEKLGMESLMKKV